MRTIKEEANKNKKNLKYYCADSDDDKMLVEAEKFDSFIAGAKFAMNEILRIIEMKEHTEIGIVQTIKNLLNS